MSGLILPRRGFLLGLCSLLAAPAIVHAANLMPVKIIPATLSDLESLGHVDRELGGTYRPSPYDETLFLNGLYRIPKSLVLQNPENLIARLIAKEGKTDDFARRHNGDYTTVPMSWFSSSGRLKD